MLECTLHFFYCEGRSADIHFWLLGIFDREAEASFLVLQIGPAALLLAEIRALFSDRYADALIIEHHSIEIEKLNQMRAQVHLARSALLVLPLQVACHEHGQKEGSDAAVVRFVQLSTLQKCLEDHDQGSKFWVLFLEVFYQLDAIYSIRPIK